jgi:hypothetical protein
MRAAMTENPAVETKVRDDTQDGCKTDEEALFREARRLRRR